MAEAEQLAESTQWKATGERFKTLLDEWKAAPRADRTGEQALWKRFSHARSQFDKHRRQYFARLDGERGEAKQVKEALVAEAEALSGSHRLGRHRGRLPRPHDPLEGRRPRRQGRRGSPVVAVPRRAGRVLRRPLRRLRRARRRLRREPRRQGGPARRGRGDRHLDLKAAKAALRGIQERWESIGHVPRGDKERIEGRLRKVEDAVRKGEEETSGAAPTRRPRPAPRRPSPSSRAPSTSSRRRRPRPRPPATPARSPTPSPASPPPSPSSKQPSEQPPSSAADLSSEGAGTLARPRPCCLPLQAPRCARRVAAASAARPWRRRPSVAWHVRWVAPHSGSGDPLLRRGPHSALGAAPLRRTAQLSVSMLGRRPSRRSARGARLSSPLNARTPLNARDPARFRPESRASRGVR